MSRPSSPFFGLHGFDSDGQPGTGPWPREEDEPDSPRSYTPVPPAGGAHQCAADGLPRSRAASLSAPRAETDATSRAGTGAATRSRSSTTERFLSVGSLTRTESRDTLPPPDVSAGTSVTSLEWDYSFNEQDLVNFDADQDIEKLVNFYDPAGSFSSEGTVIQNNSVIQRLTEPGNVMANFPEAEAEAAAALETACLVYEMDFHQTDPGEFPLDILREKWVEVDAYKKTLNVLGPKLPAEAADQDFKARIQSARRGFMDFSRAALKILKDAENKKAEADERAAAAAAARPADPPPPPAATPHTPAVPPPPPAGVLAKAPLVKDNAAAVARQLTNVLADLAELSVVPDDEREYRTFTVRLSATLGQITSLKADAKEAINDAAACGLVDVMKTINSSLARLRAEEDRLRKADQAAKTTFGAISDSGGEYITRPPVFSGDPKDLDFFTYVKEWKEFRRQKSVSASHLLHIMLKESLAGQAKRLCSKLESEEEVIKKLKKMFGSPKLLIAAKKDEIVKMRKCEGSAHKKREWLIEMADNLSSLKRLAKDHNVTDDVYNSSLVDHVKSALPPAWGDRFVRFTRPKRRSRVADSSESSEGEDTDDESVPELTGKDVYNHMIKYIKKLIVEVSHDIKYELTVCKSSESRPPPAPRPSQTRPPAKAHSAAVVTGPTVTGSPAPSTSGSSSSKKKRSKAAGSAAGPTCSASAPAAAPVPKRGASVIISASYTEPKRVKCECCNKAHEYMFYCEHFQQTKSTVERMKLCYKTRTCFRCLRMDSQVDLRDRPKWWREHEPNCKTEFVCTVDRCGRRPVFKQFHQLMCAWHTDENKDNEDDFLKSLDRNAIPAGTKFYHLTPRFYSASLAAAPLSINVEGKVVDNDVMDDSIFLIHNIHVKGKRLQVFYDSGCLSAALSTRAASIIEHTTVRDGPTYLGVAGGKTVKIEYGDQQFMLELAEKDKMTLMTALQMDEVTSAFPTWDVRAAWGEIYQEFVEAHGKDGKVPPLPEFEDKLGGTSVDLMVGIKYRRIFPKLLYNLPSGLGIFESRLKCGGSKSLVLGGPHKAWSHALDQSNHHNAYFYFSSEMRAYYNQCQVLSYPVFGDSSSCKVEAEPEPDEFDALKDSFTCDQDHCDDHDGADWVMDEVIYNLRAEADRFFEAELTGTEVKYRCLRCRSCAQCKNSDQVDELSLKEEREQALIEAAVEYDPQQGRLFSTLPFTHDPKTHLQPNKFVAEKVLKTQIKLTQASESARLEVLAAHEKLASKGFIKKLAELDPEIRRDIEAHMDQAYHIPWRVVHKLSISTPARLVFDASSATPSGHSLNSILAKGENRLEKLHNILLRFRGGVSGWSADIKMAYNQIALRPCHYRYQLFLWRDELDPEKPVETWVVTTLIYGVRPSGNLMLAAFVKLAEYCKDRYPVHARGGDILKTDAYVDDLLHSADSDAAAHSDAESLKFLLELADMSVKGFIFSRQPPPPEVSTDGTTVGLVGMVWHTERDLITSDVKPIFFGQKKRGKLPELLTGELKPALAKCFTKREVLSKLAGLWDPLGLLTPLTVQYKLGFSQICDLKVDWDSPLPAELLDEWVEHIEEIQRAKGIFFNRAVVPADAAAIDLDVIVSTDASQFAAAAVAHVRVPLKDGSFSVQLLCAKSKLTRNLTIPKGELKGVVMGASVGHIVRKCLGDLCKDITYVTDSSIALYWINADSRPLETHVRNAVVEVRRLSDPDSWFHVESAENVADVATRKSSVEELGLNSVWQNGKPWMAAPKDTWPLRTISQITIASEDKRINTRYEVAPTPQNVVFSAVQSKVSEYYKFSKYVYDPCKFNWARAIRTVAYVLKFIRLLFEKTLKRKFSPIWAPPPPPPEACEFNMFSRLVQHDLRWAEHYYFRMATKEVIQFVPDKQYKEDTVERYGILHFTGRIMDGHQISTPVDAFLDLKPLTFVKPVVARYSPIAYALMIWAHETLTNHRTASATLTESRSLAYVLRGRDLANEVRDRCQECKVFKAKLVEVEMGKLYDTRLTVAPPFYVTQCDLMGPFQANCQHKLHRSPAKVWVAIFKCVTTCAIAGHIMQDYSAPAFIQAYTRFGAARGHPALIMIDLGTQLVSACEGMTINILDVAETLATKYQVGLTHSKAPARGHNYQGQVERGIREVKRLFNRVFAGLKLDTLAWETNIAWCCNELNNMPICLGSRTDHLDQVDVITPSRIMLGRANKRAMSGYPQFQSPSRMIEQMDLVYDVWWKVWRDEKLIDFIPQPSKWRKTTYELKEGDIVLFVKESKEDHFGKPLWKIARVVSVEYSADSIVRTCTLQYKNASNSKVWHETRVSARHVAKIHHEGELTLVQELNELARAVDDAYLLKKGNVEDDMPL